MQPESKGGASDTSPAHEEFAAPTDQAVRQKAARDKLKEELKAKGLTDAEIKKARPRKTNVQENHADDCGEDLTPLEEAHYLQALAVDMDNEASIHACSFFDTIYLNDTYSDDDDDSEDGVVDGSLSRNYFWGSEMEATFVIGETVEKGSVRHPLDQNIASRIEGFTSVSLFHLDAYLSRPELRGSIDIMEIFRGEAGTSRYGPVPTLIWYRAMI